MARRYKNRNTESAPENLSREHVSQKGFTWVLTYPAKRAASLGAKKPRATITCDGFDAIYLPVSVAKALEKNIKSGETQEPESHAELIYNIKELSSSLAMQKLIDMLSRREYSVKEATEKLSRDGFMKSACEYAVNRAQELGILKDARFTESFIRSKLAVGWGTLRIERELEQKGIDVSVLEGWPEAYISHEESLEMAKALLARKSIPEKNAYEKFLRFLVSRGYSYAIAKEAISARLSDYEEFS